jgi:deoxyhypusine monooxygenase
MMNSTSLAQVLSKTDEHPMVRHEAAEALGSIATPEVLGTLQEYLKSVWFIVW